MEQVGEQHGDKQQVGKQQAGNQQAGEKQQQDDAKGDNWAGTGCEGPDGTKEIMGAKKDDQKVEGHDMVSSRALEDVGNMGLNGVNTEKGSWAKALKDKMNIGVAWNRGGLEDLPKN
ncbi:hypothetical protein V6N12_010406 [Hibiscus sabdariffa]|uniref:Uncharacterized protein n=1 Tax=Hibiscus sabdariffa TaxID=183260 RepID=A0ABR2EMC1_9ROSI